MIRKIAVGLVMLFCVAGVHAQGMANTANAAVIDGQSMDMLPPGSQPAIMDAFATEYGEILKGAGVTEESVGDPYSFGRAKTYLGLAQTDQVSLQADCTGYPPEAGRCVELNPAPASTHVEEYDLAVIELPGKSTKSILCFTFTPFSWWQWENSTGAQQTALMGLRPWVKIESDVLNDPSLVDPVTGLPFNGVVVESTITTLYQSRTLDDGESDLQYNITTRSCTGGLVNVRMLRDGMGLSDRVIKQIFKNPMTVTFGVWGDVTMVSDATYFVGVRLYGD